MLAASGSPCYTSAATVRVSASASAIAAAVQDTIRRLDEAPDGERVVALSLLQRGPTFGGADGAPLLSIATPSAVELLRLQSSLGTVEPESESEPRDLTAPHVVSIASQLTFPLV